MNKYIIQIDYSENKIADHENWSYE